MDRSAAYAGRYVAKNIVAAGLASAAWCRSPTPSASPIRPSVMVDTFGTGKVSNETLTALIKKHFDLRPRGIVNMLDLLRPIYQKTAAYGHFGRDEPEFWESTDRAILLRNDAGLWAPPVDQIGGADPCPAVGSGLKKPAVRGLEPALSSAPPPWPGLTTRPARARRGPAAC